MIGVAHISVVSFFVVRVSIRAKDAKDEHSKSEVFMFFLNNFFISHLPPASYGIIYSSLLILQ